MVVVVVGRAWRARARATGVGRWLPGSFRWAHQPNVAGWQLKVGLEIHAQIAAHSKIFSSAPVRFNAAPNTLVQPMDLALPGALPVLNKRCVEAAIRTALACGARLNHESFFDRKHYFYHDLPAGYQITQQRVPIAEEGTIAAGFEPEAPLVRLQRIQLEQDSGKSVHTHGATTLVDYNRAGAGLMEIVTEPDLTSSTAAMNFVRQLIHILTALEVNDGKLAEGSLRVDANVSAHCPARGIDGPRSEIKNINGMRFLKKAIDFEFARHVQLLEAGETLVRETRYYDAATKCATTIAMRSKEDDLDYRFMPDPDLPPLVLTEAEARQRLSQLDAPPQIAHVQKRLPELPRARVHRWVQDYGSYPMHLMCAEQSQLAPPSFPMLSQRSRPLGKLTHNSGS
ncbi:uncharacterized protein MONBRDRAFT_17321 [Monosiga brevicollis MX1]|uniref:Aspartyl/Glutamyl-tRNA(Gln) amidotransferase subunit B/E catalytic domain-containing protein n=1 Tax=Monosiga brevicollis TaxID=81824 RepID=A9UQP8_MONBE|nr:uncharacterized protein MONBRDRAFT_17321 [Monosiga brevicollis MX1]EDQ93083.1 predicted protein [Monosiga brevicollis MX1]|eukprot:XP_001742845.1 hypothetical protein [Monosiga brevicollis MX1]